MSGLPSAQPRIYIYDRHGLWVWARQPKVNDPSDNQYSVVHTKLIPPFDMARVEQLAQGWSVAEPQGHNFPDQDQAYKIDHGYLIWLSMSQLSNILSDKNYDQIISYDQLSRLDDWLQKEHPDDWEEIN